MRKNSIYFLALLVLLGLNSCNDNEKVITEIKPGFEKYISGFTSGVQLSRNTKFIVRFQQSVNDSAIAGQEVIGDAFDFSPSIKGKTLWIDNRSMEFVPDELLQNSKVYSVSFNVGNFMDVPSDYSSLEYDIRTKDQMFRYIDKGLSTYELNMSFLKYEGEIITADIASNEDIEQMLDINLLEGTAKIKWVHGGSGKIHNFAIDSIERIEENQNLTIKIDGEQIGVDDNDEYEKRIPGLKMFELLNLQVFPGHEQYIQLSFSDPLQADQKLDGLIYFESDHSLDFIIDGSRIKVFPSRKLAGEQQLHITTGIKNARGYKLQAEIILPVAFEINKPAIESISKGVIMPSSDGLIFPFKAVSLSMVDLKIIQIYENNVLSFLQNNDFNSNGNIRLSGRLVAQKRLDLRKMIKADLSKWNTFKIDLADYINLEPGALYKVSIDMRPSYSLYPCDSNDNVLITDAEYEVEVARNMKKYDQNRYYYNYNDYDYNWKERNNPCFDYYFYYNDGISQTLFASNLGITAKGTPNNRFAVIISDLISTDPVGSVDLVFYNLQKQIIAKTKTNSLGIAIEQLSSKPYFIVASKGDERAYLKLDNGEALSLSNFNVSGMRVQEGLKGFIYGERGVWRPGDNIYLTFILEDMENRLPTNHPVVFELINPMGQTIVRKVRKNGENGFYSFPVKTESNAPTGNWTAKVNVGGAVFSRTIRIETIKPNRLRAKIDFESELLTKERLAESLKMEASWLHGSPAKNLKAKVLLTLRSSSTSFKKFENYNFHFPNTHYNTEENEVFSGELDEDGNADLKINIVAQRAPGMLKANFVIRVFEKSGDFSILTQNIKYSPYESYVGLKMNSDGESGWYSTDTKHKVNIACVDQFGKPIERNSIRVTVYKVRWRWWWDSNDDLASYVGRTSRTPISSEYVSTDASGKASFDMQIKYRNYDDNGRYLIVAEDPVSGHQTGILTYFSEWYGSYGGGAMGASMLSFNSDKEDYKVGDEVKISIPSSKNGRALVSIESGSEIIDVFWVQTEDDKTHFSFPVTSAMAPNVFVHISLLQPHAQSINDNPIRMYGVIPIEVEDPETKLHPKIQIADVLKPEQDFNVKISEENGKAMTYTLAIVDEGLLDITNFKTPDPWRRFYAREALGVRTWDMYNDVIGAYGARLEKAFSIGGGGSEPDPSKNKANRFKPVVIFAGPFTIGEGKTKNHKFTMPNYIGSVRVMVIAGDQGPYGNAEKAVPVKKGLMLLATLPRVLGPQEEVILPVTIFAMSKKVKNVKINLKTNNKLQIIGGAEKTTQFTKEGDKIVYFRLKVNKDLGIATAHITATSGNLKAHYDIELDVRTPNSPITKIRDSLLTIGTKWSAIISPIGLKSTNSAVLEISGIPSMGLDWRLEQLLGYPHGCIEQTTSKIFPQLFLSDLTKLSDSEQETLEQNVMIGLNSLRGFQLVNGGFAYWPGRDYANEWGSSYAGHMLLMAEKKGYQLPSRMKSQWINFQKSMANSWSDMMLYGNQLNQAYRLYTLALAGKPELGAMNRFSQLSNLNERSRLMLALAYAEMGQLSMAKNTLNDIAPQQSNVNRRYLRDYTFGSSLRDNSIRLLLLTKLNEKEKAFGLVLLISKELESQQWLSTQSIAYSLMAVSQYYQGQKPESIKFSLKWQGEEKSYDSRNFIYRQKLSDSEKKRQAIEITNNSGGSLYARIILKGIPTEDNEENITSNLTMNVSYVDMDNKPLDPNKIEQGTDFKAIVTIRNPGIFGNYHNLALSQIFPSGWEIINTRLLGMEDESSPANYVDIRDDRVYTYFHIAKYNSIKYVVLLNAAYEGKFYKPSVNCSAMYDNTIIAVEKGNWVEVIRP